jgi:hypothetical protein
VGERATAKAAVLDASYLHGGRLDTGKVQRLAAELAARGAELWIPEVVVLEFAVHAWQDLTSNRQTHKRLRQAGLALGQELSDLGSAQIAAELLKACAAIPNVVIIEMTGESAVAALRDQILGTGPGTVDHGVRTGAADSSWVRDAFDRASNDPRAVVLLSCNVKDVVDTARALGHNDSDVPIWKRTGAVAEEEMLNKFFGPAPASPAPAVPIDEITVLGIITASLRRDYAAAIADDDRHGPPPEWIEVNDVSIGVNHDWGEDAEIETMIDPEPEVEPHVQLVDVTVIDMYATNDDGTGVTVDYIVRLLADVRVEGQKIDNEGNSYWDWVTLRDRLLRVPYTAELRDDALVNVVQTDTAENDSATPRFADNFDAYEWLFTAELATWQHITVHPLDGDPDLPKTFELRGPHGRSETAELAPPADLMDDWTLDFETTGASISATYDHTARAALGRHDSFDVFSPASLHCETRGASRPWPQPYTALAELWAHLVGDGEPS